MVLSLSTEEAQAIESCRLAIILTAGDALAIRNDFVAIEIIIEFREKFEQVKMQVVIVLVFIIYDPSNYHHFESASIKQTNSFLSDCSCFQIVCSNHLDHSWGCFDAMR